MDFIQKIANFYEVFIFTSSAKSYAQKIVDFLDPKKKYFDGILTREDCFRAKNGKFMKDLRIIKNRDLKNIILVDDSISPFSFQINNWIPIIKWEKNKDDEELKFLFQYLVDISTAKDVREEIKKRFNLEKLIYNEN